MVIGKVKGSVWATKKEESLNGVKLMVVETEKGTVVATDSIGSGINDTVLLCFGNPASNISRKYVDASIVGIIDSLK